MTSASQISSIVTSIASKTLLSSYKPTSTLLTSALATTSMIATAISSPGVNHTDMIHYDDSLADPNNPTGVGEEQHALFVSALLMLGLILVALNINRFLHSRNFHYLSETAVYILLGFVAAVGWTALSYDSENTSIQLNSKFFYMVLLPPIIFEGGFNIQKVFFFQNIMLILSYAFIGALYSTFVTSILMYGFSQAIDGQLSFISSLVFGSLISSTDPVTVLALLPANVDRRLYMLIFGESALNDAVAIILYRVFTSLASSKFGVDSFFISVFASMGVFLGSFIVGVAIALIYAKITKHIEIQGSEGALFEGVMLLIFAYSSYLLAEILELTGIISIFFCGIAMAHYAYKNLAEETVRTMKVTIRILSFICECFIFLYLGLGLLSFGDKATYDPLYIFAACFSILVSRTHIFIISMVANMIPGTDLIPLKQQILIWFSGLRGAVAFALGVTFLELPTFSKATKGVIFGTTVMVVVLTVLILGTLTPYMLVWLGIQDPSQSHEESAQSGDHADQDEPSPSSYLNKPVFGWLYRIDATYIRPYFTDLRNDHFAQGEHDGIFSAKGAQGENRVSTSNPKNSSIRGCLTGSIVNLSATSSVAFSRKRSNFSAPSPVLSLEASRMLSRAVPGPLVTKIRKMTSKETASYVAGKVDPLIPSVAKNAANFAADKASSAYNYTTKTVTDTVDYATKTVHGTVDYATKTVTGTVDYATKTVSATVGYANQKVSDAQTYASQKANSAVQFGKFVVKGATTTVTAYTPGPVLNLVTSSVEKAKAIGSDPVGSIKPLPLIKKDVPTFVIKAGDKTYEVVHNGIESTSGYVVTKVNGTVQYVTSIPQVGGLIDQLEKLTTPVLKRLGVKKTDSDGDMIEEAEVPEENSENMAPHK